MVFFAGIGGIFGALARYSIGKWISLRLGTRFPWGTWILNISGSFCLGLLATLYIHHQTANWIWLLVGTGFLGGYTTFSTFGYEFLKLMEQKNRWSAVSYVITSVGLGLFAAWLGYAAA